MNWKNTNSRYGTLPIAMHWLMLLLLIGVYATINLQGFAPKGSDLRAALKTWHFVLGLSAFVLVGARLVIRALSGPAPRIDPDATIWQQRLAAIVHIALYVFMIGMPLLGWFALSAKGAPVLIFGLQLPVLIGTDKDLYGSIKEIHEFIGTAGYYLIGLHAAAALFHHYLLRDNTLARMLPGARRIREPSGIAARRSVG